NFRKNAQRPLRSRVRARSGLSPNLQGRGPPSTEYRYFCPGEDYGRVDRCKPQTGRAVPGRQKDGCRILCGTGHESLEGPGKSADRESVGHKKARVLTPLTAVTSDFPPTRLTCAGRKPVKIYKIVRWVMLAAGVLVIFLMLRKQAAVAVSVDNTTRSLNAQSFENKMRELEEAHSTGRSEAEAHLTAGEVAAAMTQSDAVADPAVQNTSAPASPDVPKVEDYQVNFVDDIVRGQFATEVEGKQVYVTLAGHLGSKDGYVTFDPTEFKIGDLSIPVSMVNDKLQQKLREQHDRLKLPDFGGDLRV